MQEAKHIFLDVGNNKLEALVQFQIFNSNFHSILTEIVEQYFCLLNEKSDEPFLPKILYVQLDGVYEYVQICVTLMQTFDRNSDICRYSFSDEPLQYGLPKNQLRQMVWHKFYNLVCFRSFPCILSYDYTSSLVQNLRLGSLKERIFQCSCLKNLKFNRIQFYIYRFVRLFQFNILCTLIVTII